MSWLAELSALDVDLAVEAVRSMIPARPQAAEPATAAGISTTDEAPEGEYGPAAPADPATAPSPLATDHFMAVQAALTPDEAKFVHAIAGALSPHDLSALVNELSAMSVAEAVDCVRALLAEARKPGAA